MMRQPASRRDAVWKGVLVALILLGVVAALAVALPRFAWESSYRTVEVIVDAQSVRQVASASGIDEDDLLISLRDLGVTTLAVTERTVGELVEAGSIALLRPHELSALAEGLSRQWLDLVLEQDGPTTGRGTEAPVYVAWQPGFLTTETQQVVANRLQVVGGRQIAREPEIWQVPARTSQHPHYLANPAQGVQVLGLGFDADKLSHYTDLGFRVALRPLDSPALTPNDVAPLLMDLPLAADRRSVIIFDGSAVPGQPGTVNAWAAALGDFGAPVAWIEFAVQRDLDRLIRLLNHAAVRLHSIAGPELHGLHPDEAVARWLRAVTERSVRALYVRFYTEAPKGVSISGSTELLDLNLDYIEDLIQRLQGRGYDLGAAQPVRLPSLGSVARVLMFLSVGAASLLLLRRFIKLPAPVEALLVLGLTLLLSLSDGFMGRQVGAFAAAVIFPTLATVWVVRHLHARDKGNPWMASTLGLLIATAISLVGAVHVVGLLSETPFAIGLNLFMGVKAMHVVPPVLVGAALLWERPVRSLGEGITKGLGLLRLPIPLGYVLALGLVGALALLVVLRTGTDLLPVPGLEQWLRTTLEQTLGVRPRNKEFLLGHPLFVVTCFVVLRRRLPIVLVATMAAVASIGQLSLVNTFAHIHAPLATSLIRTVHGVVIGALLGLLATVLLTLWWRRAQRDEDRPCG